MPDDYYQIEQSHSVGANKCLDELLGNLEISHINELYAKDLAFHYPLMSQ